jgi:hypothetical protein
MQKQKNIFLGILILIILVILFTNTNNEPKLSPNFQEDAPKLSSNIGLLHAPCSEICWQGDNCKQAESLKSKSGNYLCICDLCDNVNKCILESDDPSKFSWDC